MLQGFSDSDLASGASDRRSTSKFSVLLQFRLRYSFLGWQETNFCSTSLAEAEYMAASFASCESIWTCKLLIKLKYQTLDANSIYYD